MPLYEFKCKGCGDITEEYKNMSSKCRYIKCKSCGGSMVKIISRPNLITDTNFGYTGKFDSRLGGGKIEGRQDFWNRVKAKGLQEIDIKSLENPSTMEERLKKCPSII
ncbi:MAG: zinc ribbon domain-containing protein [Patescibacteria group bacterium]